MVYQIYKEAIEEKGLRVNAGKTKVIHYLGYRPWPPAEFRSVPRTLAKSA